MNSCTVLVCLVLAVSQLVAGEQSGCYRAAVLDHVHQTNFTTPALNAEINLKVYETAAAVAKENGADIIVFPENGLIYQLESREKTLEISETVPNTEKVLCGEQRSTNTISVVNKLSCLAKKHKIFVAANVLDKQSCEDMHLGDEVDKCPKDKYFVFNTAVLFDRDGKLLGKYHKMHPFGEMNLNPPPKEELVVFDTELGRLGIQVCFDLIYNKPGAFLAQKNLVDTVLFPTWWFDEAPFLSASQYQMSWALSNKVNLLASNIHLPEVGSMGSGVYDGAQQQFVTVNANDGLERVIIGNVPKSSTSSDKCDIDSKVLIVPQEIHAKENRFYFYQQMNLSETEVVQIDRNQESASSCHNGVCCTLQYKFDETASSESCNFSDNLDSCFTDAHSLPIAEQYFLLTSNRTRPGPYPWTEEFCALVYCPQQKSRSSCSKFSDDKELTSRFLHLKLTGTFSQDTTVYPSSIGPKHEVIHPENNWKFSQSGNNYTIEFSDSSKQGSHAVSILGLYGRVYSRDPPYKQVPTGIL